MRVKAKRGRRPGRGSKGLHNPMLPPEMQGRAYVVKSFLVQPRIMLLSADGKEDQEILGPQLGLYEAQHDQTLPQFMEKKGLKLRSSDGD